MTPEFDDEVVFEVRSVAKGGRGRGFGCLLVEMARLLYFFSHAVVGETRWRRRADAWPGQVELFAGPFGGGGFPRAAESSHVSGRETSSREGRSRVINGVEKFGVNQRVTSRLFIFVSSSKQVPLKTVRTYIAT